MVSIFGAGYRDPVFYQRLSTIVRMFLILMVEFTPVKTNMADDVTVTCRSRGSNVSLSRRWRFAFGKLRRLIRRIHRFVCTRRASLRRLHRSEPGGAGSPKWDSAKNSGARAQVPVCVTSLILHQMFDFHFDNCSSFIDERRSETRSGLGLQIFVPLFNRLRFLVA